ncbi:MAG: nuclear transport factor 2 family protein [Clostridiales bacterium]|nr:nuclear transport factor 2 family protein [Clostridiales bacterium]
MAKMKYSLEQCAQRSEDFREIQNVMAKHVYYHLLMEHNAELDDIWVKEPANAATASFAINEATWIGMDIIRPLYGDNVVREKWEALRELNKNFPEIEVKEENLGAGHLMIHPLTTPMIEIAGDGKTAKGTWYTPGQVTGTKSGKPDAQWMWERYAVDFYKEDDEWKLWHLRMYTDFGVEVGKCWTDSNDELAPMASGDAGGSRFPILPTVVDSTPYRMYAADVPPQNFPRWPEPYYTFSETFSY